MDKKYEIHYKGKVLKTSHFSNISDEKCNELRTLYYMKPDIKKVYANLAAIKAGGTIVSAITNYYVKDLMANTKLSSPKWSIAEVFECDDLIRYFYSRILASDSVYPKTKSEITNIETALRLSGGGVAMKPSNFPMKTIDNILTKYNLNDHYYDFSCGWGVRLLSALKNNIHYYGTDPNFVLVDRLNQIHTAYDLVNHTVTKVDIRPTGSEIFHSDWENKIGLAFSSPPYFDLEDYKIGNQSINGRNYQTWLNEYFKPTIQNIKSYVISGGHIMINIKNSNQYKLYEDVFKLCDEAKLTYIETLTLNNIARPSTKVDLNTDEQIMVFRNGVASVQTG